MKRLALLLVLFALPAFAQQRGETLFETHCASAGCHGPKGVGGQGPALQDRNLTAATISDIVTLGRAGTPMAPFKDVLGDDNLKLVVEYVQALSATPAAGSPVKPAAIDPQVAQGNALFFDTRRAAWCGACHRVGNRGGPIPTDLAQAFAAKGRPDLAGAMAGARITPAFTATLADGSRITGLQLPGKYPPFRMLDFTSVPPVVRTLQPPDLIAVSVGPDAQPFDHKTVRYGTAELAAVAAFLRASETDK
jgi:mono/diheme cytochrome c family protein